MVLIIVAKLRQMRDIEKLILKQLPFVPRLLKNRNSFSHFAQDQRTQRQKQTGVEGFKQEEREYSPESPSQGFYSDLERKQSFTFRSKNKTNPLPQLVPPCWHLYGFTWESVCVESVTQQLIIQTMDRSWREIHIQGVKKVKVSEPLIFSIMLFSW